MPSLLMSLLLVVLTSIQDVDPMASATRGITGSVKVQIEDGTLRGRADLDLDSPLLVRVASIQPQESGSLYELEFIGTTPGLFDLRDVLVFADGSSTDLLPPLPVQIVSNLEDHAASDLSMTMPPATDIAGGYQTWIIIIGVLWILIPIVAIMAKFKQPSEEPQVEPTKPTLAEQLSPLVNAACNRNLSISEQGQLELLLYWHWQEELGLGSDRPEAVSRLRHHEIAGLLLRKVEAWLHDPRSTTPTQAELQDLLQPYRDSPGRPEA
ncbi:MAG: hypothetical protein MK089_02730 [Phycisphaerales bacterium]|nr:hypothetical protein [Phycisphaerales bacterium]